MKKIFTVANNIELQPFKNELAGHNIDCLIKNEFAMATVGEIPVNESWPQIWVINDHQAPLARELCLALEKNMLRHKEDWLCHNCGETNGGNFELCWQCEHIYQH